jgi:hypothetical protein
MCSKRFPRNLGDFGDRSIRPACLKRAGSMDGCERVSRDDSSNGRVGQKALVLAASFILSAAALGLFCVIRCAFVAFSFAVAKENDSANYNVSTIFNDMHLERDQCA